MTPRAALMLLFPRRNTSAPGRSAPEERPSAGCLHPCIRRDRWCIPCGPVPGRRRARSARSRAEQPELPLAAPVKKRLSGGLEPAAAAKLAVARRAKPSAVPDHVRLVLTLELRRELAEKLSERAIREERNIEAIIIALLEAAA